MVRLQDFVIGVFILQIQTYAAPSDFSKLEDIANIEQASTESSPDSESYSFEEEETNNDNSTQGARQKRFYNYYGFGFPPINPLIYPNNAKRDDSRDTGIYGAEDPFTQIHRRLQEIADVVRQPVAPPPPPSHIPIFFPVLYIPQIGCGCNEIPVNTPQTPTVGSTETAPTTPDIDSRIPVLDDERQNWGFVINETEDDDEEGFDTRPISFDPISLNTTLKRPAPPVEHGSVQGGVNTQMTTTPVPIVGQSLSSVDRFDPGRTQTVSNPTTCDGAVLSCCHQVQVTYDCFALQGCPDPTSYGNPCALNVIQSVIEKFQRFYGQRNG